MIEESEDHTAAFAEAFYIGNLLFVGVFYLALWVLYGLRHKQTNMIAKHHLTQCLIASSISLAIFILINFYIVLTSGYASLVALILLEAYFMLVVPVFLIMGILGFSKAIKGLDYKFPIIGARV